ncbi:MAG TPA: hypothetical protein VJ824_00675 [Bacillota bacterium]|nr:hypothetical protein [Bacillota bacterium]
MKLTHMEMMHQFTSMALCFVREVQEYAKKNGFILLQEEPIIHLRTEEKLRLTITQSLYIGESDIELTITGYLEEGADQEMIIEATFDLLLPENAILNDLHDQLNKFRDQKMTHFFLCVKGSKEEGILNDELSVVLRMVHRVGEGQAMHYWDQLLYEFYQAQRNLTKSLSTTPLVI